MNNRKCPYCKECLDLYFPPDGTRYYICWLCKKYFKLVVGNKLEEVDGLVITSK